MINSRIYILFYVKLFPGAIMRGVSQPKIVICQHKNSKLICLYLLLEGNYLNDMCFYEILLPMFARFYGV